MSRKGGNNMDSVLLITISAFILAVILIIITIVIIKNNQSKKYKKEIEELDIKKITLSKEDLGTNKISPQDIFILSSCIIFQIEENVNENIIEQDKEE